MIRDIQEALSRLACAFRRRTLDQEFEDEFATHIDLLTEQNEGRGLPHDEARRQAILQLGGLNATKDLHREARGLPLVERFLDLLRALGNDMLHAVRSLAKARSFTFVCLTSLGIGMGTVLGTLIVMRMLSAPPAAMDTENLVELLVRPQGQLRAQRGEADEEWSYPDYTDLSNADTGLTITGWTVDQSVVRIPAGGTRRVSTMYVSSNYFDTLGVTLARGAGFDAGVDDDAAAQPVVIVSYEFWKQRLGSDPDILGKTITLNRVPHVVAGIAPEWFYGHLSEQGSALLWVPLGQHPQLRAGKSLRFNRSIDWVRIHGRLSPGVSIEHASAAVSAVMNALAERYPPTNQFKAASVEPYQFQGTSDPTEFRVLQAMLMGVAGLVLLVVCLNISGMVMVRSAMRERELSIRQAIGAARRQLIRFLLCEAVVLATLGCALASAILFGVPAMAAWFGWIPFLPPALTPNASMIAICAGLCLITSLMFGLLPALRFSRPALSALKDEVGGGSRRVGRVHRLAAAVQVGIAVPFLVISGVLLDHVRTTGTAELGFEPKGLIAAPVDLAGAADVDERALSLLRAAQDTLRQTSGILSVAIADGLPLDFQSRSVRASREGEGVFVRPTRVDGDYLKTMGIRLVRGRGFTAADRAAAELVAVIAEPVAIQLFPSGDALGQQMTVTFQDRTTKEVTIVGVIADLVGSQMSNPRGELLLPLAQHPASSVFLVARRADGRGSTALAPAFQNAFRELDPNFNPTFASRHTGFMSSIVTGETLVQNSMRDMLTQSAHVSIGGGVALTLAALGVYGVIGFMVTMRKREIAVRIALGASNARVLRTIFKDVVKLIAPGVALGLVVSIIVVRYSDMSWYSLGVVEPLAYSVGAGIAVLVALLASLAPARRAASVQPMVAMRSE